MLETIWFLLWGVLWAVYFMLDGYDFGLGSLLPFVAKNDREKRVIYNSQGPFWDGNEVWLLTAGGVTFAAFPTTYAAMFSALYTPLMLLLFALIIRGVTFEFRSKLESPAWRTVWDYLHAIFSFVPALLLGVFFANVFMGVPLEVVEGWKFAESGIPIDSYVLRGNLFTLLNPYALLGGVLFVLMFIEHGALWGAIKAEGALHDRLAKVAKYVWPAELLIAVVFLVVSFFATDLWANYLTYPFLLPLPLIAVIGLVLNFVFQLQKRYWIAWAGSALTIVGAAGWGVAGLYPDLLPSSLDPAYSMTAFDTSSSQLTLIVMLVVVGIFVPTVIGYQSWVSWFFRGKVDDEWLSHHDAY